MIKLIALIIGIVFTQYPVYEEQGFRVYFLPETQTEQAAQQMVHTPGQFTYGIIHKPFRIRNKAHAYELIKSQEYMYIKPPTGTLIYVYPGGFDFVCDP